MTCCANEIDAAHRTLRVGIDTRINIRGLTRSVFHSDTPRIRKLTFINTPMPNE